MIAKLIVHGVDREHARMRMLRALDEFEIGGPPTLLGFHRALLSHPCFIAGETCHGIVESEELALRAGELTRERAAGRVVARTGASDARATVGRGRRAPLRRDGARARAALGGAGAPPARARRARTRRRRQRGGRHPDAGDGAEGRGGRGRKVEAGQVLCVVEAMKMENEIVAHRPGQGLAGCRSSPGDAVASGQVICLVLGE